MKVTYGGPFDAVRLPSGEKVTNGEPIEVDDDLGKSLCEQDDWQAATGAARTEGKKRVPRKTSATKAKGTKAAEAAEAKEKP